MTEATKPVENALKPPEAPGVAGPIVLMLAGPIVALLIMFCGVVSALTPEPETLELSRTEGMGDVSAPAGMTLTLESLSDDVSACTVHAPDGQAVAIRATKDQYGGSKAQFTTASAGVYDIACPERVDATVTNPAAADQGKAEGDDMRNAKIGAGVLFAGLTGSGIIIATLRGRRHTRAMDAYRTSQGEAGGE